MRKQDKWVDGHKYNYAGNTKTKVNADKKMKRWRKEGYLARTFNRKTNTGKNTYEMYRKKKW